jgi:hypothetical protein
LLGISLGLVLVFAFAVRFGQPGLQPRAQACGKAGWLALAGHALQLCTGVPAASGGFCPCAGSGLA